MLVETTHLTQVEYLGEMSKTFNVSKKNTQRTVPILSSLLSIL